MVLKTRILALVDDLRGSYWFIPSIIALTGFGAGLGLVYTDAVLGDAWLGRLEWFYGSRPEGARALLSTVAGSTITVAGVVFSITLAAVTYASGQYGPRLLSNFMRDRGNQVTLGVFIGTFLYCLVVLRTIRSAEETSADTGGALREAFVPHIAMFGALALAIVSIAMLIYFVHHVTVSIHVNNVIARIGCGLIADIERRGDAEGMQGNFDHAMTAQSGATGAPVPSPHTGYIAAFDEDRLLEVATERGAQITVLKIPGDFVHRGQPLLMAAPGMDEDLNGYVAFFAFARKRSALQDMRFLIDELVEIAVRALSPGVNDPFTAMACIDWLGAALIDLSAMPAKPPRLCDEGGRVRLIVPRLVFADYLHSAVGQLRPYATRDRNAGAHLVRTLDAVRDGVANGQHRMLIEAEKDRVAGALAAVQKTDIATR